MNSAVADSPASDTIRKAAISYLSGRHIARPRSISTQMGAMHRRLFSPDAPSEHRKMETNVHDWVGPAHQLIIEQQRFVLTNPTLVVDFLGAVAKRAITPGFPEYSLGDSAVMSAFMGVLIRTPSQTALQTLDSVYGSISSIQRSETAKNHGPILRSFLLNSSQAVNSYWESEVVFREIVDRCAMYGWSNWGRRLAALHVDYLIHADVSLF